MNEIGTQIENAENKKLVTENRSCLDVPKRITDSIECYDKSIDLRKLVRELSPKSFVIEGDNSYFVISV